MAMSLEAGSCGFCVTPLPSDHACHVAEQEAIRRRLLRDAAESSYSFPSSGSPYSSSCFWTARWFVSLPSASSASAPEDRSFGIGRLLSLSSLLAGTTAVSSCDVACRLQLLARGARRMRRFGQSATGSTVCFAVSLPLIHTCRVVAATTARKNMIMLWDQERQIEEGDCDWKWGKGENAVRNQRGAGGGVFGGQMSRCRSMARRLGRVKTRCAAPDGTTAVGPEAAQVAKSARTAALVTTESTVSVSAATAFKSAEALCSSSTSSPRRRVGFGSRLIGCGSAVPSCVISNDDLSSLVDTSDEWIMSRTGIRRRRILSGDETLTGLAVESSRKALEMGNVDPSDVDLILLCTSTPEDMFGSACQVQVALGAVNSIAFDLTAACSGFVLGLVTATRFIRGGGYKNVLVVGADALSRYVDWSDRGTCILFGDGSGAVLVQAAEDGRDGLLGFDLRSDGNGGRHLKLPILTGPSVNGSNAGGVGGGEEGSDGAGNHLAEQRRQLLSVPRELHCKCLEMNGRDVFRFAVRAVPEVLEAAMEEAGLTPGLIDWLLLHQANQRILDSVAATLRIPQERVISNLIDYGNTSAASIPLALDEAVRAGQVKPGHVVATAGFGAGLTWASAIIRWG